MPFVHNDNNHGLDVSDEEARRRSASTSSTRKRLELQAQFLIKSVEEIEETNRRLRSSKRKIIPEENFGIGYSSSKAVHQEDNETKVHNTTTTDELTTDNKGAVVVVTLRSNRALADDLSSCVGMENSEPTRRSGMDTTVESSAETVALLADRLQEIQSNADLKLRRLLHRVNHLEEQLALSQHDNEMLQQLALSATTTAAGTTPFQPGCSRYDEQLQNFQSDVNTQQQQQQQYINKLLVQQRVLIQENAKLKRELLSSCDQCRLGRLGTVPIRTTTHPMVASPPRRPTFQSSARHVLENLPTKQRINNNFPNTTTTTTTTTTSTTMVEQSIQAQRRAWSTTPQSWNPRRYKSMNS